MFPSRQVISPLSLLARVMTATRRRNTTEMLVKLHMVTTGSSAIVCLLLCHKSSSNVNNLLHDAITFWNISTSQKKQFMKSTDWHLIILRGLFRIYSLFMTFDEDTDSSVKLCSWISPISHLSITTSLRISICITLQKNRLQRQCQWVRDPPIKANFNRQLAGYIT